MNRARRDWVVRKMSNINDIDFSKLAIPNLGFNTSAITRQIEQTNATMNASREAIAKHNARKDAALFETAEASVAQKDLLAQQLAEVKEQNLLLKNNYTKLKEFYEMTKNQAESSAKEAKANKIFGWVSFSIGIIVGVTGVILGIIF